MFIRRIVAWLLALMMVGVMPASAGELTNVSDLQEVQKTFSMMGLEEGSSGRMWENSYFFQRMTEKTGVAFTFLQYTDRAKYEEAKTLAFASGDLPDVFFKANLTAEEEMQGLASGQLIDLTPLLPQNAPTLQTILLSRPEWARIITQPSGGIAALPSLNGYERQNYIWINQSWLNTLALSMPQDLNSFTEVLRAFRDRDPNGNGKHDEIPLSFIGPWEARFLLHAWGIAPNDYHLYVDDAGIVQYAPKQEVYREFITYLRDALQEGLIDPEAFRQSQNARATKYSDQDTALLGSTVSMAMFTLVKAEIAPDYVVMPPLTYDGQQVYRQLLTGVTRGTFAITSACSDPAAVLRWIDVLYTEEGGRLATAGLELEDYVWDEEGTWSLVNDGSKSPTDILRDSVIRDIFTPGLEPADFMRRTSVALDANTRRQGDKISGTLREAFPTYWPTDAAREARIAELQFSLGAYVDEAIAKFATGEWSLDEQNWSTFQQTLDERGAQELVDCFQAIYDEFVASSSQMDILKK